MTVLNNNPHFLSIAPDTGQIDLLDSGGNDTGCRITLCSAIDRGTVRLNEKERLRFTICD